MTGKQVRDARKLLFRTQSWLARRSGLSETVLSFFERTNHMAAPMHGSRDRLADLKAVLENEGVVFTAEGVRLRDTGR